MLKVFLWGSSDNSIKGWVLEKILDEGDKELLNTGMATSWFAR